MHAEGDEAAAAAAAEAEAAALAREGLMAEATRAVKETRAREDRILKTLQSALAADMRFLMAFEPKTDEDRQMLAEFQQTIEERILLVGEPPVGEGENARLGTRGAFQEALALLDWLQGERTCDVLVYRAGTPEDKRARHTYPPPPPPPPPTPETLPAAVGEEVTGLDAPPPGPPPPAEGAPPAAESPAAGDPASETAAPSAPDPAPASASAPASAPAPEAGADPVTPTEPPPRPSVDTWAREIVYPAEQKQLRDKIIEPKKCAEVTNLERAALRKPVYRHPDLEHLERHALAAQDVFAYSAPYVAVRFVQAEERHKVLSDDQPPATLVDVGMVRERTLLVETYRKDAVLREAQRSAVIAELDRMVLDVANWKTQAVLLDQEIQAAEVAEKEALQAALAEEPGPPEESDPGESDPGEGEADESDPGEGEADEGDPGEGDPAEVRPPAGETPQPEAERSPPEPSLRRRLAEARESLANLELSLIYVTAARAEVRLALLDTLLRSATEETAAAEGARNLYEATLLRLRSSRRLDRLKTDKRLLTTWSNALEEKERSEGSVFEKRLAAYQALLAVNAVARDAVQRRKSVAQGGMARRPRATEAEDPPPEAVVTDTASAPEPPPGKRLSGILLKPESRSWDLEFVEVAKRELLDPDLQSQFGAGLIAEHYAAVDERLVSLLRSRETAQGEQALRKRFDAARAGATAALTPLARDPLTQRGRKLPAMLETTTEDFNAAMDGIVEQRERNEKRLAALVDYRRLLLAQGTRSLLVRTNRDLDVDGLVLAAQDSAGAVNTAGAWLALAPPEDGAGEAPEGARAFAARSWWKLYLLYVSTGLLIFLVWWLRGRIDGWIHRASATHEVLRHQGASVKEEKEEARRRREEESVVASEMTAEAILLQTSPAEEPAATEEPAPTEEEAAGKGRATKDDVEASEQEAVKQDAGKREVPR